MSSLCFPTFLINGTTRFCLTDNTTLFLSPSLSLSFSLFLSLSFSLSFSVVSFNWHFQSTITLQLSIHPFLSLKCYFNQTLITLHRSTSGTNQLVCIHWCSANVQRVVLITTGSQQCYSEPPRIQLHNSDIALLQSPIPVEHSRLAVSPFLIWPMITNGHSVQ